MAAHYGRLDLRITPSSIPIIVLSSDSSTSLKSISSDDIVSSKGPSKGMVCRKESDSSTYLENTGMELSSSSDDIVSREGPLKASVSREGPSKELLKWYEDVMDEDATTEDTIDEDFY
ncbi:hypothetical protein Tco_0093028 [Tanacetum coccineum]